MGQRRGLYFKDPMAEEIDRQYQPELLSHWHRETVFQSLFLKNQDAHRRMCGHTLTHPERWGGGAGLECQLLYFHGTLSKVGHVFSHHHVAGDHSQEGALES